MRAWGPLRRLDEAYQRAFGWFTTHAGVGGAVGATVLLGVLLLLGAAVLLSLVIDLLVRSSGIPLIDPLVVRWFADQRSPRTVHAAVLTLSWLRGSYLVVAAGLLGIVLNRRPGRWRADVLGVVGTVGAFIPLLILAAATELSPTGDVQPIPGAVVAGSEVVGARLLYANQVTLVTAAVGLVAWLLTRRWRVWVFGVAVWTTAIGVVLLVCVARLFLGWNWPSEVVASMLLGAAWVTVFVVAWRTRDRLRAEDPEAERTLAGTPVAR
jgi:undecaprenyl-diphosphatase